MHTVCDPLKYCSLRPLIVRRLQRVDLQPDGEVVEIGPYLKAAAHFPVVIGPSALQSQHDGL